MVSPSFTITWRSALLAVLLAVAACQTAPPVQEMSDARQAIAAAKDAGAADHAAADLRAAEAFLNSAERSLGEREYAQARYDALQAGSKHLSQMTAGPNAPSHGEPHVPVAIPQEKRNSPRWR